MRRYVATAPRSAPSLGAYVSTAPRGMTALGRVASAPRGVPALGYTPVTPEARTSNRYYVGGIGAEPTAAAITPPKPPGEAGLGTMLMWGSVAVLTVGVFWATMQPGGGFAENPRPRRRRRSTRRSSSRRSSRRPTARRRSTRGRRRSTRRGSKRRSSRRYSRRHGGYVQPRVSVNRLTASERRQIPKSKFVFPERRAWPLDTKKRAKAAISYLHMGRVKNASDFNKIRNAIRTKYPDVWDEYGKGLSWEKSKRAKAKGRRAKGLPAKKKAAN